MTVMEVLATMAEVLVPMVENGAIGYNGRRECCWLWQWRWRFWL